MQDFDFGGDETTLLEDLPIALLHAGDLNDVLRLIARNVMAALDYEDCVIYVCDGEDALVQRAAWGPKSPDGVTIVDPLRLRMGEGIVGSAAAAKQAIRVIDTTKDPRYVGDVGGGRSELAVPIIFDGQVLGVIDSEHREAGFYSEQDAGLIASIAAIAAARMQSVNTTQKLESTVVELKRTQRQLRLSAETDALTGIGNRRCFERKLDEAISSGLVFGLCAFDLDGFKEMNDLHGHHEGDRILRDVAEILNRHFGASNATVARIGGDEFVALAPFLPDYFAVQAKAVVQKILTSIGQQSSGRITVSVSAGLAFGCDQQVWRDADDALYVAKLAGGDQVRIFGESDPELIAVRARRQWSTRIRKAIKNDDLYLTAQAIVPAGNRAAHEEIFEVLVRHADDDGGFAEFIDAASQLGLESEIDSWVLDRVLDWLHSADSAAVLSMNWSPASVLSDAMTVHVMDRVGELGIDPSRLIIEVTERACIESPEAFAAAVQVLRASGIRVAIDNLGSGWTSLKTLRDNPVDFIKIDGSWVKSACTDEMARVAVRSMIECATLLGATVIAESVEDESTRALLEDMGADLVQGWLMHRPGPLESIAPRGPALTV